MIKAAIYGRVGKDGSMIKTQSGIEMAGTTLAVNDASNTEDEPVWFNVVGFKRQAHEVCKLKSGDLVSIQGPVKLNRYSTKEGIEREQWQIVAQDIVGSRSVRPGGRKKTIPGQAKSSDLNDKIPAAFN